MSTRRARLKRFYYGLAHTTGGKVFQELLEVVKDEAYVCTYIQPHARNPTLLIFREFPDYGYDLKYGHVICSLEARLLVSNTRDEKVLKPLVNNKILKKARLAIIDYAEKRIKSNQERLSKEHSKATESDHRKRNNRYWEMLKRSILAGRVAEILERERVYLAQDWIMMPEASFNSACVVKDNPEFVDKQTVSYIRPEPAYSHPIEKDRRVIPVAWKTDRDIPDNSQLEAWVVEDENFIPLLKMAILRLKK